MNTTQKKHRSEKSPPRARSAPVGDGAPPIDGPSTEAGVERVMDTPDSLRSEHAIKLRDLLRRFAEDYDLEEHSERAGLPSAWMEGTAAACALCADPGPTLAAMISVLDTALDGADGGVMNR